MLCAALVLGAEPAAPPQVPEPTVRIAAAAPERPRLEWVAPPSCPPADEGAEQLARFLGDRVVAAEARVTLEAAGSADYVATVTVAGATRTIRSTDCTTLARAAALVVAVSLEPVVTAEAVHRRQTEPAEAVAAAPTPVDDDDRTEPTASPTSRSTSRSTLGRADRPSDPAPRTPAPIRAHWLSASGGVAFAHVPALTGGARLSYAFTRRALRVQAELTYALPRTVGYRAEPALGGRFQSIAVGGRACFAPAVGRVAAPLCAGVEGGPVLGRGVGVINARRPTPAYVGAVASGALVVRASARVAVTAGAELLVAAVRPAFYVGARDVLLRAPPVGLRGLAGLEVRLR